MQLKQTDRDVLLKPLQAVAGIVERRHTLPILDSLKIASAASSQAVLIAQAVTRESRVPSGATP